MKAFFAASLLALAAAGAHADAVDALKDFVAQVKTGHAGFTQTVTSPDGAKKKTSSGTFDFARPNRFRFGYAAERLLAPARARTRTVASPA